MSAPSAEQRARLREVTEYHDAPLRERLAELCDAQETLPAIVALHLLDRSDALERRLAATERVAVRWSLARKRDDPERVLDALREWVDAELAKEATDGE